MEADLINIYIGVIFSISCSRRKHLIVYNVGVKIWCLSIAFWLWLIYFLFHKYALFLMSRLSCIVASAKSTLLFIANKLKIGSLYTRILHKNWLHMHSTFLSIKLQSQLLQFLMCFKECMKPCTTKIKLNGV